MDEQALVTGREIEPPDIASVQVQQLAAEGTWLERCEASLAQQRSGEEQPERDAKERRDTKHQSPMGHEIRLRIMV
jgi:hypothetical protein